MTDEKECSGNKSSERRGRKEGTDFQRLEVKEVVTGDRETKGEKEKTGETCGDSFICPSSPASRSSPAAARVLACRLG